MHQRVTTILVVSVVFAALVAVSPGRAANTFGAGVTPTVSVTATSIPQPTPVTIPKRRLGSYYLAVGDSFSAGYLTADKPIDSQCTRANAPGFTCVFLRYLREIRPGLGFDNVSEPGADSCELAGTGHRCFDSKARTNPLDRALSFIRTHPDAVSPITVTIGGNDLLALAPLAISNPNAVVPQLPGVLKRYRTNLNRILARLRAAAPNATILLTTQPNPFGGVPSPPLPKVLNTVGQRTLRDLNSIMKAVSPLYGVVVVDSAAPFDAYPGGGFQLTYLIQYLPQGKIELHPNPHGYRIYGESLIHDSGFRLPVTARIASLEVPHEQTQTIQGKTTSSLKVVLTLRLPQQRPKRISLKPVPSGHFVFHFLVGPRAGPARIRACVRDKAHHSNCASPLTFAVT